MVQWVKDPALSRQQLESLLWCGFTCCGQAKKKSWFPVQSFLGGWQDVVWTGVSLPLLALPKFSWLVLGRNTIFLSHSLLGEIGIWLFCKQMVIIMPG